MLLGFKANQVHKKCLVDRNITLTTVFGADYLTSDALPDNIKSLLETEKGNAVYADGISNITFPNCNLEEELDNVSRVIFTTFMIIFVKYSIKYTNIISNKSIIFLVCFWDWIGFHFVY